MARRKDDLHITVDPEILEAARKKREETGRSLSHVVERALRRWIAEDPPEEQAKKPKRPVGM